MYYFIGYDIGGTKCAVSIGEYSDTIKILDRFEVPTSSPLDTLNLLNPVAMNFARRFNVSAIGISCGGPLDIANGIILCPPNLPLWHGFNIVVFLKNVFNLPVFLQNDANACAFAEWKFGAGVNSSNMVFLTFGTGIGAGLIIDGKLYNGSNGNAGELGHVRISNSGPFAYGKIGSFEAFCSGSGISKLAISMANKLDELPLCIKKIGIGNITTKILADFAFKGDSFAKSVFAKSGYMLGKGLSVIIDVLNPEIIVLGGVFMRSADLFIPSMNKAIKKESLSFSLDVCKILPAKLSENVGDVAAICAAIMNLNL